MVYVNGVPKGVKIMYKRGDKVEHVDGDCDAVYTIIDHWYTYENDIYYRVSKNSDDAVDTVVGIRQSKIKHYYEVKQKGEYVNIDASVKKCEHENKYVNGMFTKFWTCSDCGADLGDVE